VRIVKFPRRRIADITVHARLILPGLIAAATCRAPFERDSARGLKISQVTKCGVRRTQELLYLQHVQRLGAL
jgi:hypothetical protein